MKTGDTLIYSVLLTIPFNWLRCSDKSNLLYVVSSLTLCVITNGAFLYGLDVSVKKIQLRF